MRPHLGRMLPPLCAPLDLIGGVIGLQISGQRNLRIHHNLSLIRQLHDHVRPARPALGRPVRLHKIAVRNHPRQLHHAPQLHLAPTSPRRRRPQRARQVRRLRLQARLRPHHALHLLLQPRIRGRPFFFQLADPRVHPVQRTLQRLHNGAKLRLPVVQVALRRILQPRQRIPRQLQKGFIIAHQRLGAHRLERLGHPRLQRLNGIDLVLGRLLGFLQPRRHLRHRHVQLRQLPLLLANPVPAHVQLGLVLRQ